MVEKSWLAVFIVICGVGLDAGLDLFQCALCYSLPLSVTNRTSPEGLYWETLRLCRVVGILKLTKNPLIYIVSHFTLGSLDLCFGGG